MKILNKKQLTGHFLKSTEIGKKLKHISEDPIHYTGDRSLLKDVQEMKATLKSKWSAIFKLSKKEVKPE